MYTDPPVTISQFPDFVVEGDKLNISCSVSYSGLLAPYFMWHPTPTNKPTLADTGSSVNSTVQVVVPPSSVPPYTCSVGFDGSIFSSAANKTSARVKTSGEFGV